MKPLYERHFDGVGTLAVRSLSVPEQFVVGVCRCWDAFLADSDRSLPWRLLGPVFAYMNVLDAFCPFETAFRFVGGASRADAALTLEFREPESTLLGSDEARVLSCLASLQPGSPREAIAVWKDVLAPHAVRMLLPPLARIATVLDLKGHRLARWRGTPLVTQVGKVLRGPRCREIETLRETDSQVAKLGQHLR